MNLIEPDSTELDHVYNPSVRSKDKIDYYAQLDPALVEELESYYALDYKLFRYKMYPDLDDNGLVIEF